MGIIGNHWIAILVHPHLLLAFGVDVEAVANAHITGLVSVSVSYLPKLSPMLPLTTEVSLSVPKNPHRARPTMTKPSNSQKDQSNLMRRVVFPGIIPLSLPRNVCKLGISCHTAEKTSEAIVLASGH